MKFLILAGLLFSASLALANESIESSDFRLMSAEAHALANKYGKENVLLVYDIDNTLLAPNQDFGSDAWFSWQAGLIASGDKTNTVAADIKGLLEVLSHAYWLGSTHAVDKDAPGTFNQLAKEGFTTVVQTSRGPVSRAATERELARNGFETSINPLGAHGIPEKFLPYELAKPQLACLTAAEITAMRLGEAKKVSLQEGIFMVEGQHKGAMMKTLLCRLNRKMKAILMIDDTLKNVVRMHEAMDSSADVITIRYSKLDPEVERFEKSDKSGLTAQWQKLKAAMGEVFKD
jgi:hypothetical protein